MHTASSSSRDAFFSLRIGKIVTAGIDDVPAVDGIGEHNVQSGVAAGGAEVVYSD
jgi:hypothetical protein